jgi:DNA-binding LytR/AlgR family response regulator
MKVVIIEDEKLSADHLASLLKKADKNIEIIKYLDTVKAAVSYFKEGIKADLILMDIHLADGNSFEIFNQVILDTPIIFTTAYDNYSIQAFKKNSIDYLLKPISLDDLQFALDKCKKQQQQISKQFFENITDAYLQINNQYKLRFIVKIGQAIETIQTKDVQYFETKESLTFLVTTKGKKFIIDYTLDDLEKQLQPQDFFRINRKIIIHIQAIEKVTNYLNSRLIITSNKLQGDAQIVSRERVVEFKKWLDK